MANQVCSDLVGRLGPPSCILSTILLGPACRVGTLPTLSMGRHIENCYYVSPYRTLHISHCTPHHIEPRLSRTRCVKLMDLGVPRFLFPRSTAPTPIGTPSESRRAAELQRQAVLVDKRYWLTAISSDRWAQAFVPGAGRRFVSEVIDLSSEGRTKSFSSVDCSRHPPGCRHELDEIPKTFFRIRVI
jgi:hypothetical protein